jgi:hypothetical protein
MSSLTPEQLHGFYSCSVFKSYFTHRTVPEEYEDSSSKIRASSVRLHNAKTKFFSETVKKISIKLQEIMVTVFQNITA